MMAYATITTLYEDAVERHPLVVGILTGVLIGLVFLC